MKILIVDDDQLIRDGLKTMIRLEDGFTSVDTVSNGQEALDYCINHHPDVVVMDIRMPIMDGVIATKEIKKLFPTLKIVILTTFNDIEYLREAVKAGVEGYILKTKPIDQIIENIRSVYNGHVIYEKEVSNLLSKIITDKKNKQIISDLTGKELEIIKLIADGLSNKEIANAVYMSEGTVRNYISSILEKLKLRDRTQLAIYFIRNIE